ncbi:MAG: MerR family transcriptional regulator [Deltaproteobacteria bacterium]|nr:MerR family transcriptional regulator [Deltaproteobacteria bacterium]
MKDLERATGVSRETIRYYIREGLLPEPERPGRNVAWYDASFVEHILLIKRLQGERFLPLSVIKGIVGDPRELTEMEERALHALDGHIAPAVERAGAAPRRTRPRPSRASRGASASGGRRSASSPTRVRSRSWCATASPRSRARRSRSSRAGRACARPASPRIWDSRRARRHSASRRSPASRARSCAASARASRRRSTPRRRGGLRARASTARTS